MFDHTYKMAAPFCAAGLLLLVFSEDVGAQSPTFAGDAQHTGHYNVPAQPLNQIHWSTRIDLNSSAGNSHYGAPLITSSNTVITPVRTASGFRIDAFEGATGRLKYTLTTDYVLPPYNWLPPYQPVILTSGPSSRLYYPGAGGTVYYLENPDSDAPETPVQQCFYTDLESYRSNATAFKAAVFINSPITAGTNGAIYFGFRVSTNGTTPPFTTTNGGFVRLDSEGNAAYVLASAAANDSQIARTAQNCAPALSVDGSTVYVAVKGLTSDSYAYLLGLDSTTLVTKYKARLQPIGSDNPRILDDSTSSPLVGPDGDVFFGAYGHSGHGFLLHYSGDLLTRKTPGGFGWDNTPAIVPTNMVPFYTGNSPYLLFSKYNDYAYNSTGINRVALLDPNAAQVDPLPAGHGVLEMREVLTVIGCTPDAAGAADPYAVREWCINAAAVNPSTFSVFAPCEDGRIYRWNLALHSLVETLRLGSGLTEPYVPSAIGPDGQVYALNGGTLFALGGYTNRSISVFSSAPDFRDFVVGQPVTFTAIVTNLNDSDPEPSGTITFRDVTYRNLTPTTNVLAANVPLNFGAASIVITNLTAGTNYFGNHFITADYSGDPHFEPGSATLVQKVHAKATTMTLTCSTPGVGSPLTVTASVSSSPAGGGTPSGMVSFWNGPDFLAQIPLTNGVAAVTFSGTNQIISASYSSDTMFASCSYQLLPYAPLLSNFGFVTNNAFQFYFSNIIGMSSTVLGSEEPGLPLSNWNSLGPATEIQPGLFRFTDWDATNYNHRFYRVRLP